MSQSNSNVTTMRANGNVSDASVEQFGQSE